MPLTAPSSSTISTAAVAPFGLKPPSGFLRCFASSTVSRASAWTNSPWSPASAACVTVFNAAEVSLTASIGPPGSAIEIDRPATNGARLSRAHSSSVKSAFDAMGATS